MTIDEVNEYYKTLYNFRQRTDFSSGSLFNWRQKGFIPLESQVRLEQLTNGVLKADLNHIRPIKKITKHRKTSEVVK